MSPYRHYDSNSNLLLMKNMSALSEFEYEMSSRRKD